MNTFILRFQFASGQDQNIHLGNFYSKLIRKSNPQNFEAYISDYIADDQENLYGVIISESGQKYFLSCKDRHYIMTDSGQTFEKL